jgi:hypothetical protein
LIRAGFRGPREGGRRLAKSGGHPDDPETGMWEVNILNGWSAARKQSNFGENIIPLSEQRMVDFAYPATRYSVSPFADLSSKAKT